MTKNIFITAVAVLLSVALCPLWAQNVSEDCKVGEFSAINLRSVGNIIFTQSDTYSCRMYKRQNKLFHFHKTFCSEFDIINTKQNVHFTKVVSPIFQFCLSLHQFSIGAKVPFINKRD